MNKTKKTKVNSEKRTSVAGKIQSTCQRRCHPVNPYFLMLTSFVWVVGTVVTLSLQPARPALPILCVLSTITIVVPTIIISLSPAANIRGRTRHSVDVGTWLLYAGFLSLFVQLFFRLCTAWKFGGTFQEFDFGKKCLFNNQTETGNCQNIAFVHEFNSYGHMVQGLFSLFLSPSVHVLLRFSCTKCTRTETLLGITDLLPLGTVVYPTYNVVKRGLGSTVHDYKFAVSSFSNNCAEWGFGFLIGIHLGYCCEAYAVHHNLYNHSEYVDPKGRAGSSENASTLMSLHALSSPELGHTEEHRNFLDSYHSLLRTLRVTFGVLLLVVSVVAGILFAVTWDDTLDKSKTDTANRVDTVVENTANVFLIIVPVVIWLAVSCILGWKFRTLKIEKKKERESYSNRRLSMGAMIKEGGQNIVNPLEHSEVESGGKKETKEVELSVIVTS